MSIIHGVILSAPLGCARCPAPLLSRPPSTLHPTAQGPIPMTEPFRVVLSHMRDRLYRTREVGGRGCARSGLC